MFNRELGNVTIAAFIDAAQKGGDAGLATVQTFIAQNRNNAGRIDAVNSALIQAAQNGHAPIVAALLAAPGIDIDVVRRSLDYAASNGHAPVVTALLAIPGIDINTKNYYGYTPLMCAASNGHAPVVTALLAKITNINHLTRENDYHRTLEQEAARHPEIVALIRARIVELERLSNNLEEKHSHQQAPVSLTCAQQLEKIKEMYQSKNIEYKKEVPHHLKCPISLDIMTDPVTTGLSGITYERAELEKYFSAAPNNSTTIKCPMTNKLINKSDLGNSTSVTIKNLCKEYIECEKRTAELLTNAVTLSEEKDQSAEKSNVNRRYP